MLVIKIDSGISNITRQHVNKVVTVWLNEPAIMEFIKAAESMSSPEGRYPHGKTVPGGFFFSPDWLGAE
ncbi:MAG: hypothetical protein RTU30_06765 [Candidatus Thorarchaeota archaeon]